jgi:hypothetical protein
LVYYWDGNHSLLSKDRISEHSNRLSIKSYKKYYGIGLKTEARNQNLINDGNLKGLLLSPQSRKTPKGYTACSFCFSRMKPNMTTKIIHQNLQHQMYLSLDHCHKFYSGQLSMARQKNNENEVTDTLKAMMAPVRPYGCVFPYSGGAQNLKGAIINFLRWIRTKLGEF